ncbi:putative nucleotidyltransferase substrate binding domain-containing protein [Paenarthrobacter sp. NPDC091669]|uniref:putative nucleotidyltransferase substrate binding domain-containing protein n=1 Tax=Paenarthrobacter sp. NPDC091669 TaxID=3364384 RepID=UPI0037F74146
MAERAAVNGRFVRSMIRSALSDRPPVGFVRNRVIERLGDGKRSLNLKESGLRPIASLARALALRAGNVGGSTFHRLETAEATGMLTRNETETLKSAFTLYHSLVTDQQVAALRRGSSPQLSITPERLDPLTRRHLRDGFRETAIIQERIANEVAAEQW